MELYNAKLEALKLSLLQKSVPYDSEMIERKLNYINESPPRKAPTIDKQVLELSLTNIKPADPGNQRLSFYDKSKEKWLTEERNIKAHIIESFLSNKQPYSSYGSVLNPNSHSTSASILPTNSQSVFNNDYYNDPPPLGIKRNYIMQRDSPLLYRGYHPNAR